MDYKKWLDGVCTNNSYEFIHNGPIVQGSTQVHSFKIPAQNNSNYKIYATYKQQNITITKKLFDNSVTLTEQDTFKFKIDKLVNVQLKIVTDDDNYIVSPIFNINVIEGLNKMQMTNDSDFYALEAEVNKQNIHVNSFFESAMTNTYLKCKFNFDASWDDNTPKLAYFKDEFNHNISTQLVDDWCLIPEIILSQPGIINVGVYSTSLRNTMWSNSIYVKPNTMYKPYNINSEFTSDTGVQPATEARAGILKLYNTTGNNTDGAMTQKSVTDNISNIETNLSSLDTSKLEASMHTEQEMLELTKVKVEE